MRLIDADCLMVDIGCVDAVKYGNKTEEQQHNSYSTMMMYEIADCIDDAETIDAVPVVRCKDCIYRDIPRCCPCQLNGFRVTNDWYCPMGVKEDA